MEVFGTTGWKNGGKTTLMGCLLAEFYGCGYWVSTIKHAHNNMDMDQPDKDSHRHKQAGALQIILTFSTRWDLMLELHDIQKPPLLELLAPTRDINDIPCVVDFIAAKTRLLS